VKSLIIYNVALILFVSQLPLYSRDYKKTEDMIKSILTEENEDKSIAPEDKKEDIQSEPESDTAEKNEEDDKQRKPAMSGKDAILLKNGIELYNSSMLDSSMAAFNDLLTNYSGSSFADNARIWAGRINNKKNKYDEAIDLFSAVSENSGEYPASLFYTGEALLGKGDLSRSIETYKKLYNSFPENEFADKSILMSGKLYLRINKGYQALESVITIIKNYNDRDTVDDAYYLMAKIYEKDFVLKDNESARRVYRIFINKADAGEKYFKDSPLLTVVKKDLDNLERTYFRLER
jgi:TolA-binding protein